MNERKPDSVLRRLISLSFLAVPLCAFVTLPLYGQTSVKYRLAFPNATHHEAEVHVEFSGVPTPVLEVVMSRSSPGRYALHEFAKNVYNVRASDGSGHPLSVTRPNAYGWNVTVGPDKKVVFEYTVFGDRADGTYNGIDETHAHLNMPALLAWAHGFEQAAATVHFDLGQRDWRVATQMLPEEDGDWHAPNLEWLMDCPVEISRHALPTWRIEDAEFRLSLHHQGTPEETERYARMCKAVVLEEEGVFGAFPKYDGGTYTFLLDYLPYVSFDGMEHRDSTSITAAGSLSGTGATDLVEAVSHEFFHSWNVRRIRPKSLEPFDFEHADMSDALWFAEGFTNYYGVLTLQRANISALASFTRSMGGAVNAVLNAPGRLVHSPVEMSELAPFVDAATSIDPNNFRNTYISYYTYGQALALGVDLAIRERFEGKSLDGWMQEVWRQHPDIEKPYTLMDLQTALGVVTGDKAFAEELFRHHIFGKEPMDYAALLAPAGMLLRKAHAREAWWGRAEMTEGENGLELKNETIVGTPLYVAGLGRGDRIVAVNRKKVKSREDLKGLLAKCKPGDTVRVEAATRAGIQTLDVQLGEDPQLELVTFEQAGRDVSPQIEAFRKAWLSSKALHALPDIK